MQTVEDFAQAMIAMPESVRTQVVESFVRGVLLGVRHDGRLADTLVSALGAYGVAVVIVDENGVKLHDAWSTSNPRGEEVTRVMDKLHDAISTVLDAEMPRAS